MNFEDIYNLSDKFAPPNVDLRKAQILDDYGDESYAQLIVNHKKPDDVNREEFDYYGWVYPFMEPEDLIFYLYTKFDTVHILDQVLLARGILPSATSIYWR